MENKEQLEITLKILDIQREIDKATARAAKNSMYNLLCVLAGTLIGSAAMYLSHKDSIQHYNVCQESQLLDSISRIGDDNHWYIKEDAFGKIKIVQLSNNQIDSLRK